MVPFIIVIIVLSLLILGISFLGFWMVFYSKNDADYTKVELPDGIKCTTSYEEAIKYKVFIKFYTLHK